MDGAGGLAKGWGHIKLYFIIGSPTETDEDITGIADLAQKVVDEYFGIPREERNKQCQVVVSTACFIPKLPRPSNGSARKPSRPSTKSRPCLKIPLKTARSSTTGTSQW